MISDSGMSVITESCTLPLPPRIPASLVSQSVSYSDHEAVHAVIRLVPCVTYPCLSKVI